MQIWDLFVRIAHWTLVVSILGAWLTSEIDGKAAEVVHEWLGYAALAVLALRIPWGWIGSRYARFSQFVRGPRKTIAYARSLATGHEPRHLGHNPLGAWMIVALIVMIIAASGSGWLYVTDRFWGEEWLEDLHEGLANILFTLVALHVAGVVFSSLRHRENLVRAMITGRKRAPQPGDVD
ncbi:MAG: cytochrome [Burkholderiales bacterium]|nr:cytochrome [Burkholderiales bacterium]